MTLISSMSKQPDTFRNIHSTKVIQKMLRAADYYFDKRMALFQLTLPIRKHLLLQSVHSALTAPHFHPPPPPPLPLSPFYATAQLRSEIAG